jgi:hypothetical protein
MGTAVDTDEEGALLLGCGLVVAALAAVPRGAPAPVRVLVPVFLGGVEGVRGE